MKEIFKYINPPIILKAILLIITLLCLCLLYSCKNTIKDNEKAYVISELAKSGQKHFTEFPDHYYYNFNFIIDSEGLIYYYENKYEESKHVPPGYFKNPTFINLLPEKIVQVPKCCLIEFCRCNVIFEVDKRINISIGSQKDSISSNGFSVLYNFFLSDSANIDFQVRHTTYEENTVMFYKRNHIIYYPSKIDWDSNKIVFLAPPILMED